MDKLLVLQLRVLCKIMKCENNQLITRGIDTRRHDSSAFIKIFQGTLRSSYLIVNALCIITGQSWCDLPTK
jgi:hypothetical protein